MKYLFSLIAVIVLMVVLYNLVDSNEVPSGTKISSEEISEIRNEVREVGTIDISDLIEGNVKIIILEDCGNNEYKISVKRHLSEEVMTIQIKNIQTQ
jgi:hypothetical protein